MIEREICESGLSNSRCPGKQTGLEIPHVATGLTGRAPPGGRTGDGTNVNGDGDGVDDIDAEAERETDAVTDGLVHLSSAAKTFSERSPSKTN